MKNIGSITAIYYALVADVVSISDRDDNEEVEITLGAGKSFSRLDFTLETASFSEDHQNSDAGPYYGQSLGFKIPKAEATKSAIMNYLPMNDYILAITDANDNTWIMGTLETPARCSFKVIRPAGSSGYNGFDVSFVSNCKYPAPLLDESFVLS